MMSKNHSNSSLPQRDIKPSSSKLSPSLFVFFSPTHHHILASSPTLSLSPHSLIHHSYHALSLSPISDDSIRVDFSFSCATVSILENYSQKRLFVFQAGHDARHSVFTLQFSGLYREGGGDCGDRGRCGSIRDDGVGGVVAS